ncbi:MAG: SpoIIE family protein phosphatase [Desulfoferrobacter sp.]
MNGLSLEQIPLFSALEPEEIEYLTANTHRLELAPQSVLLRENDFGDRFYIILSGELEIVKALGKADQRVLSVRGPGHSIGEISLLEPGKLRTASVVARTRAELLEMTRDEFNTLLARQPSFAYELARYLSNCLCEANDATIRELREKNRQLAQAYQDLKEAQAQIIAKEKLERELQLAKEIQQSMLPLYLPRISGFDFGARMIPAKAVGGDFFDIINLDEGSLGIAVGDVSGKGVPAALYMAVTRSLLRAEAGRYASPREALLAVNLHLLEMCDSDMFVTVLYGVLDTRAGFFQYARAGHEVPLLVERNGNVSVLPRTHGQALGFIHQPALDEQKASLSSGDTLLIYSDGLTEATNSKGELFGPHRLKNAAVAHRSRSAQDICNILTETVMEYQGGAEQDDDMTLVAVHTNQST